MARQRPKNGLTHFKRHFLAKFPGVNGLIIIFQEYLYIAPLHVQLEATKSFSSIIQNGTIPAYMFASSFLPIILHNLDNRDTGKFRSCLSLSIYHQSLIFFIFINIIILLYIIEMAL